MNFSIFDAAQLGSIMNVSLSNNGECDDLEAIMLDCLGYIEGCTDIEALNYSENATVDNGSCEYFCPGMMILLILVVTECLPNKL